MKVAGATGLATPAMYLMGRKGGNGMRVVSTERIPIKRFNELVGNNLGGIGDGREKDGILAYNCSQSS